MRFVPVSKLAIVATVCVLLSSCSQAALTQPYVDAEINIGEGVEKKIVVAAPEVASAPTANASPGVTPAPQFTLPGKVEKQPETKVSPVCEGVANEIAYHFDGLMKCDQLYKVIISLPKADQASVKQLLTVMLAWKNEHCIAPTPFDALPIYPVKPDGPDHDAVPMPYDMSKETHGEPAVYKRDYVPCTVNDNPAAEVK